MAIGSKWAGKERPDCDICKRPVMHAFVDGLTSNGQWGIMCPTCRLAEGRGQLGVGLGQKYELINGEYRRTV
jgi:hypothetical protein